MIDLFEKSRHGIVTCVDLMNDAINKVNKVFNETLKSDDYVWCVTPWFDIVESTNEGYSIGMDFVRNDKRASVFFLPDLRNECVWMTANCEVGNKTYISVVDITNSDFYTEDDIAEVFANVCRVLLTEFAKNHIHTGDRFYVYSWYYDEIVWGNVIGDNPQDKEKCLVRYDDNIGMCVSTNRIGLVSAEHIFPEGSVSK